MHEPFHVTGKVILHRVDLSHDAPGYLRREPFEIVSRFGQKVYLISHDYPTFGSYVSCRAQMYGESFMDVEILYRE
jgi:hypothetical protein